MALEAGAGAIVTYCAAKAGSFALALLHPRGASEQYGQVTMPLPEQAPTAIEDHMRLAHTTESILPSGGLPAGTANQFSRYFVTGSTGRAGVVPSYRTNVPQLGVFRKRAQNKRLSSTSGRRHFRRSSIPPLA
jgi:hypothetical protein